MTRGRGGGFGRKRQGLRTLFHSSPGTCQFSAGFSGVVFFSMGDREWIAHHEAAHAVVAFLLERRVHLVSIRPTEAYGGVVVRAHGPRGHYDESLLFRPTVLWPAKLRRELEVDIMIALAGDVGEELALGPRSGFGQPEHERQAESALRALSDLSRRERERLDHLEGATTPLEPDQEQALPRLMRWTAMRRSRCSYGFAPSRGPSSIRRGRSEP